MERKINRLSIGILAALVFILSFAIVDALLHPPFESHYFQRPGETYNEYQDRKHREHQQYRKEMLEYDKLQYKYYDETDEYWELFD